MDVGDIPLKDIAGGVGSIKELGGDAVQAFGEKAGTGGCGVTPGAGGGAIERPVIQGASLAIEPQGAGGGDVEGAAEVNRSSSAFQKSAGAGGEVGGLGKGDGF